MVYYFYVFNFASNVHYMSVDIGVDIEKNYFQFHFEPEN